LAVYLRVNIQIRNAGGEIMARSVDPKILRLRKLLDGDHEVMDDQGNSHGVIKHAHLMQHLRQYQEGFDRLSSVGFGVHTPSVDREVMRRVQGVMERTGVPVDRAYAQVLASDESLADRYRRAHSQVDDVDGPPHGGRSLMDDAEGTAPVSRSARILASRRHMTLNEWHGSASVTTNGQGTVAVLLTSPGAPVETPAHTAMHRAGAQLREIAVLVPGTWVKGDHKFSITKHDMADMVRNFAKRKNDMIVIDYEHASEDPQIARGGPIPGAGWIHGLHANGKLSALVEWTPQAEEMLRTGQYRFFSPAIDWGMRDKETGEPQGATLTSGALTNHPFLEELPPIMLSDGTLIT
jgi:Mu-like prophage I protein